MAVIWFPWLVEDKWFKRDSTVIDIVGVNYYNLLKYWPSDGKLLASGWINSGLEMLQEVFGQINAKGRFCRQNNSLLEILRVW